MPTKPPETPQEQRKLDDEARASQSLARASKTRWMSDLRRPVVHEHRTGGAVITHMRPSGGKSRLMNELIEQFRGRETGA